MRVCIHRGTHEIGGTCVEIESQGKRIVLDIGLPLDGESDRAPLPPVPGFKKPDESLLGVIISHPHQDHYGLAGRLPQATQFLMGAAAHRILEAARPFLRKGVEFRHVTHLENRRPITVGPFRLTPYLVDHSAYDSYGILVEADGRRLFYSGDFRAHGYKGRLFESLLKYPPRGIDVLLMEGTTLGRNRPEENCHTEAQLVDKMAALIQAAPGLVLMCCSGQNIDRIVTVFKATRRARRKFIMDGYTAHICRATGNQNIPQPDWDGVRVFWPRNLRVRIKKTRQFALVNDLPGDRIFPKDLPVAAPKSVMLFRDSMIPDFRGKAAVSLEGAILIYSLWPGYLERESTERLRAWLKRCGIPMYKVHTSGHAPPGDLRRLQRALAPGHTVPIHTNAPQRLRKLFGDVEVKNDGQWWEV
jgi:ribonuclease J